MPPLSSSSPVAFCGVYLIMPGQWTLLGLCLPTSIRNSVVECRAEIGISPIELCRNQAIHRCPFARFAPTPGETSFIIHGKAAAVIIDSFTREIEMVGVQQSASSLHLFCC